MAVDFKTSMTKAELLEIAAENGIEADDSMTKAQIVAELEAHNDAERAAGAAAMPADSVPTGDAGHAEGNNTTKAENAAEGAQDGAGNDGGGAGTTDTTPEEAPAEGAREVQEGYDLFVYAGPSLPRGRLKENAVFNGTREDVRDYLADVLEEYPQIDKLIVQVNRLAVFSVKVKTPGNIAHKYYNDIVSTMRGHKEV